MSSRMLARFVSSRFSSISNILSEKEKAAGNISVIKNIEKEKLEKFACIYRANTSGKNKGTNPEEKPPRATEDYTELVKLLLIVQSGWLYTKRDPRLGDLDV